MKPFPYIIIGFVSVVVVFGIIVAGTPQTAREYRIDNQRIEDLQRIEDNIQWFYQDNERLPENLSELDNRYDTEYIRDPVTDHEYGYKKTGDKTFELCATFSMQSPPRNKGGYSNWQYEPGPRCFEKIVRDVKKPIYIDDRPINQPPIVEPIEAQIN